MALATWWRGDTVPSLSLLPGFRVEASRDEHLIAHITRLVPNEVRQRMHTGHQPYLAYVQQAPVGQLSFRSDGGVGLAPFESRERAQAGAALLGIPLIEAVLAPCWSCGGATHTHSTVVDADTCWPPIRPTTQRCTCAIELKPSKTRAA